MRITVNVTEEHLNDALPTFGSCPVALAIAKVLPDSAPIVNYSRTVKMKFGKFDRVGILPEEAIAFIRRYDNNEWVTPFTFTMEVKWAD